MIYIMQIFSIILKILFLQILIIHLLKVLNRFFHIAHPQKTDIVQDKKIHVFFNFEF